MINEMGAAGFEPATSSVPEFFPRLAVYHADIRPQSKVVWHCILCNHYLSLENLKTIVSLKRF